MSLIKVGIVGGTGYTGSELIRILVNHPHAKIHAITSRKENGIPVWELFPSLRGISDLTFSTPEDANLHTCDVVFFATPHGVAMEQAPNLLKNNVKVIDLAADFRIKDPELFEKWYKMPHQELALLDEAVYGLVEINRQAIKKARLVGLAGCYPTAVQLGFAPLLHLAKTVQSPIKLDSLVADCKSGVSGAGRKAEISSLFVEASENFKAYGVAGHRHLPEIIQGLEAIAGQKIGLTFVPHLVPMMRGIQASLYAPLLDFGKTIDYQKLFEDFYRDSPFVDVMPAGSSPETKSVRGSNQLRIAVHRPQQGDMLVILVVEDNLVKGASGQGVQCMNLMFGLDETTGLQLIPLAP